MRKHWNGILRVLCALVAVALVATTLSARMAAQDRDDDDPPGRAARLGHIEGQVSFQPAGESEWVQAVPNRPMTTGDKLWTDRDSRAEVQLGSMSIRLSGSTGLSFLNLDDRTVQIQLNSGAVNLRVRHLGDDDVVEVDTPNQAFSVQRSGRYRIEASEDGTYTVVTVREGRGESTGNGQTFTVNDGQSATFSGTDRLNAEIQPAGDPDDFDMWCDRRDHRFDDSPTSRYVSRDVVGAEDLDQYGQWQPSPVYGNVWYPNVAPGWAPYHTGHWAWIDPWGWTWVDDAPWGYAPFHYGRWVNEYGRWGWVPGPVEARPVYAPALVVFVGGGGPAMGGNVAWFPLGPREVYVPPYHVSPTYVNSVNVSNTTVTQTTVTNVYNTTIINNNNTTVVNNVTYANKNVSGAVTAVPQQAFAGGQSVAHASVPVTRQQLAAAPVSARVAVAPAHTAVVGVQASATAHVAAPPAAVMNRPVLAKSTPPPPPVSFAAKQQMLAAHPGQPVARQQMQQLRPASAPQPLVKQVTATKPANASAPAPAQNRPAEASRVQPPVRNEHPAPAQPTHPEATPAVPSHPAPAPAGNEHPAAAQPPANRPMTNAPAQGMRPVEPSRPAEAPARPTNAAPAPQPKPAQPAAAPQPQQHPQPAPKPQPKDEKKH